MYCICIFTPFYSVESELWNHCSPGELEQFREKVPFSGLPCLIEDASLHSASILGSYGVWSNGLKVHKEEINIIVPELDSCP